MILTSLDHIRRNVIAYAALFFALSGPATAAGVVLMRGDPAGGDLTGAYPDPQIAAGAVGVTELAKFRGISTRDVEPLAPASCSSGFGRQVAGLEATDYVIARPTEPVPSRWPVGLLLRADIEEAGGARDVTLYVCNVTAAEIDPPPATFQFIVIG